MSKNLLLVYFFCLGLFLTGITRAVDTPPAPKKLITLGPTAKLNNVLFQAYVNTTGPTWTSLWNRDTQKISQEPGSEGYEGHSKNPFVAQFVSDGKNYSLRAGRAGVAPIYFTLKTTGKVPRYAIMGELVTVIDTSEFSILQNPPIVLIPELDYFGPGDPILRIRAIVARELSGNFDLKFAVKPPGENVLVTWSEPITVNKFNMGTDPVVYERPLGSNPLKGDFYFDVAFLDSSKRTLALSRFVASVGEYQTPGRIDPTIDEVDLWVDEDLNPDALAMYGRIPRGLQGTASVYYGNKLIASSLELHRKDLLVADLRGTKQKFPAVRERLVVYFHDTGCVLIFNWDNRFDPGQVEPLRMMTAQKQDRHQLNLQAIKSKAEGRSTTPALTY